ncbi:MAG: hypothetical protein ABFR89_04655 [Actinomycetota bacterium]
MAENDFVSEKEALEQYVEVVKQSREHIEDVRVQNQHARDRLVMTLAGGALVLSVTLLTSIVEEPRTVWALEGAWGLLALSLVAVALSYTLTEIETDKRLRAIGEWLRQPTLKRGPKESKHTWSTWTNRASVALLIVGLVFLMKFAIDNYPPTIGETGESDHLGHEQTIREEER